MPWFESRGAAFMGKAAALDVVPPLVDGVRLAVRLLTLAAMGSACSTTRLWRPAETAASLNRREFALAAGPPAVENGRGPPVNALAIF